MTDNPWIEWSGKGGITPLERGQLHHRRYRDGGESDTPVENETTLGERSCIWSHDAANPDCDIIAYRLVTP